MMDFAASIDFLNDSTSWMSGLGAPHLQIRDRGPDGIKEVAAGGIEIGLGQISEIIANKDVVLVGPFPAAIQGAVTFSAAVHAAAKEKSAAEGFIQFLTTPLAKDKFKAVGFTVS
jgi:ABC-type molybdate transport system substrate-binding protein